MPRVLIIEDEEGVRMTLEDRLTAEGYQVRMESNGLQGEESARSGEFDIILLDLMLPGRDGFAVCRNLRNAGIRTPILMLTARNTNLDTVMGLRQGADDFVAKPLRYGGPAGENGSFDPENPAQGRGGERLRGNRFRSLQAEQGKGHPRTRRRPYRATRSGVPASRISCGPSRYRPFQGHYSGRGLGIRE